MMKRFRPILFIAVGLFAIVFIILSWSNSVVVTGVSIHIKDGVKEHTDHTLLGIGAAHHLPDYKVKLHVNRKFLALDLGTKLDTSATNWIDFTVNEVVPMHHLQEVMIVEDDKIESDLLDRIQISDENLEGASFQVRLTTARSFDAGMNWFFDTPPSKAISAGIAIGVLLVICSVL